MDKIDKRPNIIIIEDHSIVREGLLNYFHKTGRFKVAGTAGNLDDAKKLLLSTKADILILDIQLKDGLGLSLIPWLKQEKDRNEDFPIIAIYTAYDDFVYVSAALTKGAQVYMNKRRSVEELEEALLKAINGEKIIDDTVQTKLEILADTIDALTRREAEIFTLVKSGLSNKQIADKLEIKVRTVENILSIIYDKVGVNSRQELQDYCL